MYKTLGRTHLLVSRIGLGTAEIGFAYGLDKREVPSESEAMKLLWRTMELGINFFETANFYGVAEERIGKSGICQDGAIIATKCGQFLEKGEDPRGQELERRIREQIESSLRNLQLDCLPILMLHGPSVEQIRRGELTELLQKIIQEGKARYVGVATRGEEAPLAAIESGAFDVIQVAYSILDQRMSDRVFTAATEKNIGVINRSVFLKGVLAMKSVDLPDRLHQLKSHVDQIIVFAREHMFDPTQLALYFVLNNDVIGSSLIGTSNKEHIATAREALIARPLSAELIEQLETFRIDDPLLVDPAKWPKA